MVFTPFFLDLSTGPTVDPGRYDGEEKRERGQQDAADCKEDHPPAGKPPKLKPELFLHGKKVCKAHG